MPDRRHGLAFGIAAYGMWGVFPLYWRLLEPAGAVEILAHRIVWSALVMVGLALALRRTSQIAAVLSERRTLALLVVAACLVSINWGAYIWGVNSGRVVETSLGYFINPLVTVLMGVVVLGERLRRLQWVAMGVAAAAVLVLTADYGRPPWIALVLAFSFGSYGLAKKTAGVDAIESLTIETVLMAPFAFAYILVLLAQGQSHFGGEGTAHAALMMSTGIVTAIPLLCFGAAAIRVSMVSLGLMQYLAPIIQFSLGVFVLGEDMPASRWIGFVLVWIALVIFTVETINHRRRQLRLVADATC